MGEKLAETIHRRFEWIFHNIGVMSSLFRVDYADLNSSVSHSSGQFSIPRIHSHKDPEVWVWLYDASFSVGGRVFVDGQVPVRLKERVQSIKDSARAEIRIVKYKPVALLKCTDKYTIHPLETRTVDLLICGTEDGMQAFREFCSFGTVCCDFFKQREEGIRQTRDTGLKMLK